jgi:hypothetical protein
MRPTDTKTESDLWHDRVFISRQKEIRELSTNFSRVLDHMVVDRPLTLDPKLLVESEIEEEEEEEMRIEPNRALNISEAALLLLHEIDVMRKETHQLILSFRPGLIRSNPRLGTLRAGIQDLYSFLDSLRVRAERLLSIR